MSLCVGTGLAPGSGGWRWERSRRTLPLPSPSGLAWVGFTPSQVPSQGNQSTRQESVRVRSPCPLSDGWCGLRGQRKRGRGSLCRPGTEAHRPCRPHILSFSLRGAHLAWDWGPFCLHAPALCSLARPPTIPARQPPGLCRRAGTPPSSWTMTIPRPPLQGSQPGPSAHGGQGASFPESVLRGLTVRAEEKT